MKYVVPCAACACTELSATDCVTITNWWDVLNVALSGFWADNWARSSLRSRYTTLRSSLRSRSIIYRDLRSPLRSRSPGFWPAPLRFPLPLPLRSYALLLTVKILRPRVITGWPLNYGVTNYRMPLGDQRLITLQTIKPIKSEIAGKTLIDP
jgi:hypothetical protein